MVAFSTDPADNVSRWMNIPFYNSYQTGKGDLKTEDGTDPQTLTLCQKKCEEKDTCVAVTFDKYSHRCSWHDIIPEKSDFRHDDDATISIQQSCKFPVVC